MQKLITKKLKYYDKNKKSSYLLYWDNNLYGLRMSQKLSVNNFEGIEDISQYNEDFIKTIIKKVMKFIFLKLMFNILKDYMNFIMIYHFHLRGWRLNNSKSLLLIYMIKLNMLIYMIKLNMKCKTGIKSWTIFEKNS